MAWWGSPLVGSVPLGGQRLGAAAAATRSQKGEKISSGCILYAKRSPPEMSNTSTGQGDAKVLGLVVVLLLIPS